MATMAAMGDAAEVRDRESTLESLLVGERPLTARSVIASALLGTRPPRLPVGLLVHAGSLFGIGEGAVRTALWRMVAGGELESDDHGYRLAGPLLDRKRRLDESHAPKRRQWDGTWELAVVSAERRSATDRNELRGAAIALHLVEIREGVWARPDNLDPARLPGHEAIVDAQCLRFSGARAPAGVESRFFDLDGWSRRARSLEDAMDDDRSRAETATSGQLAHGFLLSIAVVRHLQRDPLLPEELLPADWPGDRLRRRYERYDAAYKQRLSASLHRRRDPSEAPGG